MNINQYVNTKEWMHSNRIVRQLQLREVSDFDKMEQDEALFEMFYNVGGFYEGLGVLVRENLIDVRLIAEMSSGAILGWWAKFGPGVVKCREAWKFPRYCIEIEYLAKRIEEYGKEHTELGVAPSLAIQN